jgi:hypothetical protein
MESLPPPPPVFNLAVLNMTGDFLIVGFSPLFFVSGLPSRIRLEEVGDVLVSQISLHGVHDKGKLLPENTNSSSSQGK